MKHTAAVVLSFLALMALAAFTPSRGPLCGQGYRKNETCATVSLRAVGATVRMKWTVSATPSDSLTVDASATGQPSTHRMYVVDTKTDSIDYPKPAPGASITVSLLTKNWRLGRSAAAPLFSQTYVEPDTIVVVPNQSVQVLPTSVLVMPGAQVQFTATIS